MEAKAHVKYVRISPRKVKIVCDLIRGKDAGTASAILMKTPNAAAEVLGKLLKSAVANAENNHSMNVDTLYVSDVRANPGPILKRIRAAAKGRAVRILKRTTHISLTVSEKE